MPDLPETGSLVVRTSVFLKGQVGVIAKKDFSKDTILFSVKGPILPNPTAYSFSVGINKHIDPLKSNGKFDFGHYLNHSCDPNTFIKIMDTRNGLPYINIVARRGIKNGEELTFDYASLEYDTVVKTKCRCSAVICREAIHGFKDLPIGVRKKYQEEGMIPTYLLKLLKTKAAILSEEKMAT